MEDEGGSGSPAEGSGKPATAASGPLATPPDAPPAPRLAFYADDFTGATDTLATTALAGLRALLFLRVPDPALLARVGNLDVLGIAGAARSMADEEMEAELLPMREFFTRLGARVLHYKTCSTFDSSPTVGSIGKAVACLRTVTPNPLLAIVGGQPNLNRYCVFGNLFATVETGGPVFRIDRHETMSRHPVTPMTESDLRLHLSRQGLGPITSIDYTAYDLDAETFEEKLEVQLRSKPAAVLFDVGQPSHLAVIGRTIWQRSSVYAPLLAVGASSVLQALVAHWTASPEAGMPAAERRTASRTPRRPSGPVLVVAGSLSGVTARQRALARSYAHVAVDPQRLAAGGHRAVAPAILEVEAHLAAGRNVLVHTRDGGQEPHRSGADARLAHATGGMLRHLLERFPLKRIGIAGGDTSSHAVKALDCWGLGYLGPVAPGVALCRLHADNPTLDGLEIMLKGGQMGQPDIFERLLGAV